MDRRTAVVLTAAVVLMIGAGVGLLVVLREIELGKAEWEAPEGLAGSYVEQVEEACARTYTRPAMGGSTGTEGGSAGLYAEALDLLPDLTESEWAQIMDEVIVDSWNGDTPPLPPAVGEFGPAVSKVLEGAGRRDGRSKYAFCAQDADVEVLQGYRRLARAVELVGKSKTQSGDEKSSASLLAAAVQMELDLGRGGGIIGHALALSLVEETSMHALAAYAEVARDREALHRLIGDLARLESSWLDFGDNVKLDGLVEETTYAHCFMPPGWDPPVGPPVITSEESDSICSMGPQVTGSMWQAARDRSTEIASALAAPTPSERYAALLAIENEVDDTPMWLKIFQPEKLLAELGVPSLSPRFIDDSSAHTLLVLTRAMLSLRLLGLEAQSLPSAMDETAWSGLYDGGRPLREPWSGTRPLYVLRGETVTLSSTARVEGWSPPGLSASIGAQLAAH
jgi:hypothetical protein